MNSVTTPGDSPLLTASQNHDFNTALSIRYVSFAGALLSICDSVGHNFAEHQLIWRAKTLFAKVTHLLNRYLIPLNMIMLLLCLIGVYGLLFSKESCASILISFSAVYTLSLTIAQVLVLMSAIDLWHGDHKVLWFMDAWFVLTYGIAFVAVGMALDAMRHTSVRQSEIDLCIDESQKLSHIFVLLSAMPLLSEATAFRAVCWNALNRPHQISTPLRRTLMKDGVLFFSTSAVLRVVVLAVVVPRNPSIILLGIIPAWTVVSMTLSARYILLQRARSRSDSSDSIGEGTT